jgi:glycosyltransferase involved in cell wall biosynthesis
MRILHCSALSSPYAVDGVNAVVWTLAGEQALAGHDVVIALGDPTADAREFAAQRGLRLEPFPSGLRAFEGRLRDLLHSWRPEVAHLHSVFTPRLAVAAWLLRRADIPYVVTPHGGVSPRVLHRNRLKKVAYSALVERRRMTLAAALTAVVAEEVQEIESFAPRHRGPITILPNPVAKPRTSPTARPADGPVVFLGRIVIETKGLDRLLSIARCLPDVAFDVYGDGPDRAALAAQAPPNLTLRDPVFGSAKASVLASARLYLQPSRWDALPVSLLEAMMAGVPCAVSSDLHIATAFDHEGLGLVLPADTAVATGLIRRALEDPPLLALWSKAGQAHAERHFSPAAAVTRSLEVYRRAISRQAGDEQ